MKNKEMKIKNIIQTNSLEFFLMKLNKSSTGEEEHSAHRETFVIGNQNHELCVQKVMRLLLFILSNYHSKQRLGIDKFNLLESLCLKIPCFV